MAKSAREIASRWKTNLSAASAAMTAGVNAVTESPMEKAAQNVDRMVAGVQRAAADGSIARGLQRVSLPAWKDSMIKKAIPRIPSGAASAEPKMEAFLNQLLPHIESGRRQLESMPRGDEAQNDARMLAWAAHMRQFRQR